MALAAQNVFIENKGSERKRKMDTEKRKRRDSEKGKEEGRRKEKRREENSSLGKTDKQANTTMTW